MEKKYYPKKGFLIGAEDAETMGRAIERLQSKNDGACTPDLLVAEAKPVGSPIHDFFEWDNVKAGEQWRLTEARRYLRGIEIVVERDDGMKERQRANHVVKRGDDRVYVSFQDVVESPDLASQILEKAKDELVSWYHRYQKLARMAELAGVFQAVEMAALVKAPKGRRDKPTVSPEAPKASPEQLESNG